MILEWRSIHPVIEEAIHRAQVPWIGTRYSSHQREIGSGVSCYSLVACILDSLYGTDSGSPPAINVNAGACNNDGAKLVLWFRRAFPLDEVEGSVEPGDLVVSRSIGGNDGPDWAGHVMMAGMRQGQAIHALPSTGVDWGSLVTNPGRVLRVYRPQGKARWPEERT